MRSLANTNWMPLELLGFSANLGPIDFSEINKGEMLLRFIPDEGHKNRSGFIHCGVIMTFADIAAAKILRTTDPTFRYTNVQTDIQFLNTATTDKSLICKCTLQKRGRSLAFVSLDFNSDGVLVASAKSIWRVYASVPK